jgi:hypothetical protein
MARDDTLMKASTRYHDNEPEPQSRPFFFFFDPFSLLRFPRHTLYLTYDRASIWVG